MQMTPRRFVARYGFGLAILALASGMVVGFSQTVEGEKSADGANMPPPPEVSVAQVVSRDVRQWDEFTGRVAAVETVELRPRVSGYVERVAYREGQDVRKGDLQFVVDPRPYRAALDQALANLERAKAEQHLAQTQDRRAQTLIDAKAISREEF